MDGAGMGILLKLLGECTKDDLNHANQAVPVTPGEVLDRDRWLRQVSGTFAAKGPPAPLVDLFIRHPEYSLMSRKGTAPPSVLPPQEPPAKCAAKIFSFSSAKLRETIRAMRRTIQAEILTVNNVVGATLWLSITHIRLARMRCDGLLTAGDDPVSKMGFAINARSRLEPVAASESYLGNLTMFKVVGLPATELEGIAENFLSKPSNADHALILPVITAMAAVASAVDNEHIGEVTALADQVSDFEDIGPG